MHILNRNALLLLTVEEIYEALDFDPVPWLEEWEFEFCPGETQVGRHV